MKAEERRDVLAKMRSAKEHIVRAKDCLWDNFQNPVPVTALSELDAAIQDLDSIWIWSDTEVQIPDTCDHGVSFDQQLAETLTVPEIRERWPRLYGECPRGCGFNGIAYASRAHFVYGDW